MTRWAILAPGPSARAEDAEIARDSGYSVGCVSNAFELAPWCKFIAASDAKWWRAHTAAMGHPSKFSIGEVAGVEKVCMTVGCVNSGVLGLEVAKRMGAMQILLLGFDMHGDHFFGRYTNGLNNTGEDRRKVHLREYAAWARENRNIEVINCTPDSALDCFPRGDLCKYC